MCTNIISICTWCACLYMYAVIEYIEQHKPNVTNHRRGSRRAASREAFADDFALAFAVLLRKNAVSCYFVYLSTLPAPRSSLTACHLIKEGAATIFGPSDPVVGGHIQSLADSLDIPHIESRLDLETDVKDFSINLHPDSQVMGNSLKDLVSYLNWTKIAVLYQDDICK